MFDLTSLDYIYIGLVLVSTVWASIRGGVYETVTMFAWLVAALAARFVSPYLGELFQGWFKLPEPTIGTLVASYFIVFFVILLTFSFFNQKLRDRVQESMMRVTDHTLGIVFGIVRGIVVMGFVYWALLYYYSDSALPEYVTHARTRPIMQLTIVKIHKWFIPGQNKLLDEDIIAAAVTEKDLENLINPAVKKESPSAKVTGGKAENVVSHSDGQAIEIAETESAKPAADEKPIKSEKQSAAEKIAETAKLADADEPTGTGYKESERNSLENKILQIESVD